MRVREHGPGVAELRAHVAQGGDPERDRHHDAEREIRRQRTGRPLERRRERAGVEE